MYSNQLARTGVAGLVIAGVTISMWWLAAAALGMVTVGALLVRLAYRHGRSIDT